MTLENFTIVLVALFCGLVAVLFFKAVTSAQSAIYKEDQAKLADLKQEVKRLSRALQESNTMLMRRGVAEKDLPDIYFDLPTEAKEEN